MNTENDMTVEQTAEALGIDSKVVIDNWLRGGDFPGSYQRDDGQWYFPSDVVVWVKKRVEYIKASHKTKLREEQLSCCSVGRYHGDGIVVSLIPPLTWGDIAIDVKRAWSMRAAFTIDAEDETRQMPIPPRDTSVPIAIGLGVGLLLLAVTWVLGG